MLWPLGNCISSWTFTSTINEDQSQHFLLKFTYEGRKKYIYNVLSSALLIQETCDIVIC